MSNNIHNQDDDEALWKYRLLIHIPAILLSVFIATAIVLLLSVFIKADTCKNAPVHDVTAVVTGNIPTETSIPATEETIPETTVATEETVVTEPTETVPEATESPLWTDTSLEFGYTDRELLAIVIYQEAGGNENCDECRRRVADVVLNRVLSEYYPDSVYEVLIQYRQYGTLWKTGIQWPPRHTNIYEQEAVARAYRIADEVLAGYHSELYGQGYIYQAGFVQGRDGFWHCGTYWGR